MIVCPTMVVRLKNTVRLQVKTDATAEVKRRFGRDFVVTEVLRGLFGVSASLISVYKTFLPLDYGFDFFSTK